MIVAKGFEHDAAESAKDNGLPTIRMVVVDGYVWGQPTAMKPPLAEASVDAIIKALTTPLTEAEKTPPPAKAAEVETETFTAESYQAAAEEFNRVFLERRWGDGLPLIPPTPERVKWMLSGTSRSPTEVIGDQPVPMKMGIATVQDIAINAVMAGAEPRYLPVIIAAMEAYLDKNYDPGHPQSSMGNFTLLITVSGPIAAEIGMNVNIGYLNHGWRPNATIGRAFELCLINLGRMWPGENEMARVGKAMCYTYYVIAENEEFSPWPPFHVAAGYKEEDSCVTVNTVGSYGGSGLGMVSGNTAEKALQSIIKDIAAHRSGVFGAYKVGVGNPGAHPNKYIYLVDPEMAKQFVQLGFSSCEMLREYIYEATRVPYEELSAKEIQNIKDRIGVSIEGVGYVADRIPPDLIAFWQDQLKPGGRVPILMEKMDVNFFVTGYPAVYSIISFSYIRAPRNWSSNQTKKIYGATLTQAGK